MANKKGNQYLIAKKFEAFAIDVWFDSCMIHIRLLDGREISEPLEWFPRLRDANDEQRNNWRLIGKGSGIYWQDLDDDICISALLRDYS